MSTAVHESSLLRKEVVTLRAALIERDADLAQRDTVNANLEAANAKLADDLAATRSQLRQLQNMIFGRKAERFEDPNQHKLFTDGEHEAVAAPVEEVHVPAHTRRNRGGGGRMTIDDGLPCVDIIHELPKHDLVDPVTGETLYEAFGFRVSKKLGCIPASYYAERHLHTKYRLIQGENLVHGDRPEALTAPATLEGLDECLAAPSLLAELMYGKYVMHTPFDRQLKDLKRKTGVTVSHSTVSHWAQQVAQLCAVLVDLMKRRLIQNSTVIQHDDTPVKQPPPKHSKRQKCITAHLWSAVGQRGSPGDYIVYDYTETWHGDHVADWFKGIPTDTLKFFQADDFAGYNQLFGNGSDLERVGCWAHARRKFHNLRASQPGVASHALTLLGKLYDVERELTRERKDQEEEGRFDYPAWHTKRQAVRQERSKPLLAAYFAWCKQEKAQRPRPKDPVVGAINYSLNQEDELGRYLDHGQIDIDNNPCESSIRPVCVGKKNWLFTGSEAAGKAAALIYSLVASAERHGINPRAYLEDLIRKLRGLEPKPTDEALEAFLPDRWQAPPETARLTPTHAAIPALPGRPGRPGIAEAVIEYD